MKKSEQNVADHEEFEEKYTTANKWLTDAQSRFSAASNDESDGDSHVIVQVGISYSYFLFT